MRNFFSWSWKEIPGTGAEIVGLSVDLGFSFFERAFRDLRKFLVCGQFLETCPGSSQLKQSLWFSVEGGSWFRSASSC
jgi:hypothetical protein